MARESDIHAFGVTKIIVPPGATLAVYVSQTAGEVASVLKYLTGGSMEIQPAPLDSSGMGTTWAGASLVPLIGNGYLMGTSEALSISGPARYYIMATGATVTCNLLRGKSSGF